MTSSAGRFVTGLLALVVGATILVDLAIDVPLPIVRMAVAALFLFVGTRLLFRPGGPRRRDRPAGA